MSLDARLIARAMAAHPGILVAAERYAAFVAARRAGAPVAALHTDDLYLACACIAGDPAAIARFDHLCVPAIDRAVSASGGTAAEVADVRQLVRQRLLVAGAGGEEPRLASYAGQGALVSWVRVVATREAARLLARERRAVAAADDELDHLIAGTEDPEIDYLKRLYRHEFRTAFRAAVEALSDRERVLLRQYALDGLSVDKLAAFYRTHRSTAARWIKAARAAVLDGTRSRLRDRLQITAGELDSVMRLIASRLEVSLPALLALAPR